MKKGIFIAAIAIGILLFVLSSDKADATDNTKGDGGKVVPIDGSVGIIHPYTFSNFYGVVHASESFLLHLKNMNRVARDLGIVIVPTSSFRKDANVKNAIVTPAKMSNHMVGEAIDVNFIVGTTRYDSKNMLTSPAIVAFFDEVKKFGTRWGGDFKKKDIVHLDSGLNLSNPEKWQSIYSQIHSNENN